MIQDALSLKILWPCQGGLCQFPWKLYWLKRYYKKHTARRAPSGASLRMWLQVGPSHWCGHRCLGVTSTGQVAGINGDAAGCLPRDMPQHCSFQSATAKEVGCAVSGSWCQAPFDQVDRRIESINWAHPVLSYSCNGKGASRICFSNWKWIVSLGSYRQVIIPYHNSTDTVAPRKGVPVRPARSHPTSMLAANPACGRSRCESLNKSGRWPQTLPGWTNALRRPRNKNENISLGWWGLRISVGEKPLLADTCPKAMLSRCPYTNSYYAYDVLWSWYDCEKLVHPCSTICGSASGW